MPENHYRSKLKTFMITPSPRQEIENEAGSVEVKLVDSSRSSQFNHQVGCFLGVAGALCFCAGAWSLLVALAASTSILTGAVLIGAGTGAALSGAFLLVR